MSRSAHSRKSSAQPASQAAASPAMRVPERLTVVGIDGNSISVLAASMEEGGLFAEALEHVELERLVEQTKRLRHPVFMDVRLSVFPERELLESRLRDLLQRPVFQRPVVVLLSPEKAALEQMEGLDTVEEKAARQSTLLSHLLPINPYDYPCMVRFQELLRGEGRSCTRLLRLRAMDVVPYQQLLAPHCPEIVGISTALGASSEVVRLLARHADPPLTLCDVGKLRTLYTTLLPGGEIRHNPIPVGLARDDMHYFSSITPHAGQLQNLEERIGRLLFPPEATPSPVFSSSQSSPQIDCTRIAIQISRYAIRSFQTHFKGYSPNGQWPGSHYLSGRGSRLPGLRGYMESKLDASLRRVDRRPLPHVRLGEGVKWAEVGDNLLLLGAALEALRPSEDALGLVPLTYQPAPTSRGKCSVAAMREGQMYVFEHRSDPTAD